MVGGLHFDLKFFFGATNQAAMLEQKHYILTIHELSDPSVCDFIDQQNVIFEINKMDCENESRATKMKKTNL